MLFVMKKLKLYLLLHRCIMGITLPCKHLWFMNNIFATAYIIHEIGSLFIHLD